LLFVGRTSDTVDSEALIRGEAKSRSIMVNAIGTAHHKRLAPDLFDAADQAEMAAGIVAAVPQLGGIGDISSLGVWALLASVVGDRSYLQVFSPAAFVLCTQGDETQRHTIEVYLDGACHVAAVCEELHIHRATLYYRLERMPQVVRDALDDGAQRSALHMCLKLIRLWESTGRI
jgi:sugar diacid utilization regulator